MKAIAAQWDPGEVRLWAGSALAALLVHLVPAALLALYLHWSPRLPPVAGSPAALDVELTPMPPSGSPAASPLPRALPRAQTAQPPAPRPHLAAVSPVLPLGQMQSIPQPDDAPSNSVPVAEAPGAISAPAELSDLGASGAPDPGLQLWEDEIVARLASYKEYPRSAVKQQQQDTVKLQISVDHTGQVTYSAVDSAHHYPALEQEVQQMLRLAGRLPTPPAQLSDRDVVTVPVQFGLIKRKAAPARPKLASCTAAASPGPAPMESTATLEQMRAYRARLNQYLAAAGSQLACLSQVREASALPLRNTLTRQLHSMVDQFNAEARVVEAKAQAQAQAQAEAQALQAKQAQQTRQREAQALAARVFAACTAPPVSQPPGELTAKDAPSFRRQLLGYQAAVSSYIDCLRKADVAAAAPDRGLADDQRAQLAQTAMQLGRAAIVGFNQVAVQFNAQVPDLRQQALAAQAQQNLAEAVVRGARIFPSSIWNLPVPLPAGECVHIIQVGQGYRARLCKPTYITTGGDLSQELKNGVNQPIVSADQGKEKAETDAKADALSGLPAEAFQQEATAAQHANLIGGCNAHGACAIFGIAVASGGVEGQVSTGPSQETITYSVSELQVVGRRVSMTISGRSDQNGSSDTSVVLRLDLALAPDKQTLHGYCWVGNQRLECTLFRHQ